VIWTVGLCLFGIFLGLNWNVLILIPVSAGLLVVFGITALVRGTNTHELVSILLPIVAVQGGYIFGLIGRDVFGRSVQKPASTKQV
jgi:hypothetical protein